MTKTICTCDICGREIDPESGIFFSKKYKIGIFHKDRISVVDDVCVYCFLRFRNLVENEIKAVKK